MITVSTSAAILVCGAFFLLGVCVVSAMAIAAMKKSIPPTEEQIDAACMIAHSLFASYDDLMKPLVRDSAKDWLAAWESAFKKW